MIEITINRRMIRPFVQWGIRITLGCVLAFALLWLLWGGAQTVSAEPPWPEPPAGTRTQLPILSFVGSETTSQTLIQVQNVGSTFTRAIMLVWGEPGACSPQAVGPFKVECSGIMKPGATWIFGEGQVPAGAGSGIVYTFPQVQILVDGERVSVADEFCERLFDEVTFDADAFRRFDLAFRQGNNFFGLPTTGGQPVAVDIVRIGQGTPSPDLTVSGGYAGLTGPEEGAFDPVFGGFAYYAPIVYGNAGGLTSWLYIQNSGLDSTGVELWFQEQNECLRAQIVEILCVAPGETARYNVSDAVGPSFVGSVWIRTSQPAGVIVDHIGQDLLMTDKGVAARNAAHESGSEVLFGPLVYREFQGWETSIAVQNLSGSRFATVKVYFYDESGNIITTLVDHICPRGTQTFFLPVINGLPGRYVGAVRVESLTTFGNAATEGPFIPIAGVAHLRKYTDPMASQAQEAISYNLFGESQSFDWQQGPGNAGLIGVPSVLKQGRGLSTELAIQNVNPNPGFVDFAIYIYDQNGLLDVVCEKLNANNVEYINFNSWGILNPGFVGSVVISSVATTQRGGVGLTAVAIQRVQSILQFNAPGDESSGHEAFPIFTEDFDFEGPHAPLCPGQPQPCTGRISGRVENLDPGSNGAVEQAPINSATARADTGESTTTNVEGTYNLDVTPGDRTVTFFHEDFLTLTKTPAASLDCFDNFRLDAKLICEGDLQFEVKLSPANAVVAGAAVTYTVGLDGWGQYTGPHTFTDPSTNASGVADLIIPVIDTRAATVTVTGSGFEPATFGVSPMVPDVDGTAAASPGVLVTAFADNECANLPGGRVTHNVEDAFVCGLGSISGRVTSAAGSADDFSVAVYRVRDDGNAIGPVLVDTADVSEVTGNYVVAGLTTGAFDTPAGVVSDGYRVRLRRNGIEIAESAEQAFTACGEGFTGVNFP